MIVSPEAPGEIWAHYSHIEAEPDSYRCLAAGDTVSCDYEPVPDGQDGYHFRATRILCGRG